MQKTRLALIGELQDSIRILSKSLKRFTKPGLVLSSVLAATHLSQAQDTNKLYLPPADLASGETAGLPSFSRIASMSGTRISRGNIGDWRDRLSPEFIDLIRAGNIIVVAQEDRKLDWPSEGWSIPQGSSEVSGSRETTGSTYPFGSYEFIEKSSSINERAEKVLANINSIFSSHGFQRSKAEVLNFENGRLFRGYKLIVERLYPKLIDPSNSSAQVFREKVTVLDPSSISGLSWLTFRFSGADEDLVFHYSPFSKKSVQLSGPNRLDRIAGTSIALDDFNTWSGKPEMLSVSSVEKSVRFFPISYDKALKGSDSSPSCKTITKDSSSIVLNTNHAESDLADWAPLNIPFIEREVITLNLATTDFHNPIGKVVLQVDLKTFLPLTKSYYDRSGNLVKFGFSIFNLAEGPTKFNFTPLASFFIDKTVNRGKQESTERIARSVGAAPKVSDTSVILYRTDERCSALPTDMSLNDFDLKGFGIKVSSPQDGKNVAGLVPEPIPPLSGTAITPKNPSNKEAVKVTSSGTSNISPIEQAAKPKETVVTSGNQASNPSVEKSGIKPSKIDYPESKSDETEMMGLDSPPDND